MKSRLTLVIVCLALGFQGRAADFKDWVQRLENRHIIVSAGIWDLPSGKLLEGHATDLALVPASTTKVVSTYAMLKTWKPHKTFETEVWGDLKGHTVQGDLIVKGGGDPFLISERVWLLAQELRARGVQKVTGRVRLDQSAFDGQVYGDGWGATSANTTPVILPLSINFNRDGGRLLKDPEPMAQEFIQRTLRDVGITVDGQATQGEAPRRILTFESLPLRTLIQEANKHSNNFMVEMMVKAFGGGSWQTGVKQIQEFYRVMLDLGPDKVVLTDGSGLSKSNHLSARTLGIILRAAWHDFEVGPEFVSSLKFIGGEDFVLKMKDKNLERRIRCKTGHVNGVYSICGYMNTFDGHQRVFAIILNGPCDQQDVWDMVIRWAN